MAQQPVPMGALAMGVTLSSCRMCSIDRKKQSRLTQTSRLLDALNRVLDLLLANDDLFVASFEHGTAYDRTYRIM